MKRGEYIETTESKHLEKTKRFIKNVWLVECLLLTGQKNTADNLKIALWQKSGKPTRNRQQLPSYKLGINFADKRVSLL